MLTAANVEAVIYTEHSHTPEAHRFRVVVPLAGPVPGKAWPRLSKLVSDRVDEKCKHAAAIYFVPSHSPGKPYEVVHVPGERLTWWRA